ncbi:MAG: penicillin-binding transpeptidase domain-containing protein [Ezakiella sp.]|nr:penicillin-binding transpeptidase domain-containing protein [Ezakiella sp.]
MDKKKINQKNKSTNKTTKKKKKSGLSYQARFVIVVFIIFSVIVYISYRHASIAILNGEKYRKESLAQLTKNMKGNNNRGDILDSTGVKIAVNVPAFTIWANPKYFADNKEPEKLVEGISSVLEIDSNELWGIFRGEKRKKLVQWASEYAINKLYEIDDKRGLEIEERTKRFYNDGVLYNHITGFTDIDSNGLSGIELTFNNELNGEPERIIKKTDAKNQILPFENTVRYGGKNHGNVILTINDKIQRIAWQEAMNTKEKHKAKSVSIIVMDPMTGDIYAMADTNTFDANNPRNPIDDKQKEDWQDKTEEEMVELWQQNWNNLNVNVLYEPGSTFKAITLAAAIEEGRVDDSTDLYCNGAVTDIPGVILRCVRWQNPHGHLNITDSFSESCNVAFIQIARLLGKENFYKYIKAFGFGEKSGVDLNAEQVGLIPNNLKEMTPVRLATASYGQGIAATNMQMAMATAATINGGDLLKPRIVKEVRDGDEIIKSFPVEIRRKVISKSTSDKMREIMEYSVEHGNKRAKASGYRVGGKSGTAYVAKNGKYVDGLYYSSFIGVAPINDPKILVLVGVEEPGDGMTFGGAVAGPVSARIMEKALPILGVSPEGDAEKVEEGIVTVPDILGKMLPIATKELRELGLQYYIAQENISEYSMISSMSLKAGTNVPRGTIIDLEVEAIDKEKIVPNFVGLNIVEAIKLAEEFKIEVKVQGEGNCVSQSKEAGTILEKRNIELIFAGE